MLSDLIQLNVIKSHTQFQRVTPVKYNTNKLSLQIQSKRHFESHKTKQSPKNWNDYRFKDQDSSIIQKQNTLTTKQTNSIFNSQISQEYCFKIPVSPYCNKKIDNFTDNCVKPVKYMIKSLKDGNKFHNIQQKSIQKIPLIVSPKNKLKSTQRSSENRTKIENKLLNSSKNSTPLLNSNSPINHLKNYNFNSSQQKYIFRSLNHGNLSPLKSKKQKTQNNNFLNIKSQQKNNIPSLNRSNSFKKAIQLSRQKQKKIENNKNLLKQTQQSLKIRPYAQNGARVQTEYYENVSISNKQNNPYHLNGNNINKSSLKQQKLIKLPVKNKQKVFCQSQKQFSTEKTNVYKKLIPQKEQHKVPLMKQDSYIDDIVNNSNFSNHFSKQDSKILNMEPY